MRASVPARAGVTLMFVVLVSAEIAFLMGAKQFQPHLRQIFSVVQTMRVVAA
jgi:hypothetical protein